MGLWWSEVQILSPRPDSEVGRVHQNRLPTSLYASLAPRLYLHISEKCSNCCTGVSCIWTSKSHGSHNEIRVRSQKAQEKTSSCPRATFFLLSPGCETVLRAKLAHIVLKAGQSFNA